MVMGDLYSHLEQGAFDILLMVQGLMNYVTFPTHERGGPCAIRSTRMQLTLPTVGASGQLRSLSRTGSGRTEDREGRRSPAHHLPLGGEPTGRL